MAYEGSCQVSVKFVKQSWGKWLHERGAWTPLLLLIVLGMQGCIAVAAIGIAAVAGGGETVKVQVEKTPQEVYGAMLRIVNENPDIKLDSRDDAKYIVKASRGKNRIEAHAKLMDNGMTELAVKATPGEKTKTPESMALKAVKKVCDELGVPYKVVQQKKKK